MTFKYNNVYINNTETIAGKKEKEGAYKGAGNRKKYSQEIQKGHMAKLHKSNQRIPDDSGW